MARNEDRQLYHYTCQLDPPSDNLFPCVKVVQLTSLRPTADLFCSLLRDALKAELLRGQMKSVKGFVKTCYSEVLVASGNEEDDRDGSVAKAESMAGNSSDSMYLGGLGLKFKFPGDARKYVHCFRLSFACLTVWSGYERLPRPSYGPPI